MRPAGEQTLRIQDAELDDIRERLYRLISPDPCAAVDAIVPWNSASMFLEVLYQKRGVQAACAYVRPMLGRIILDVPDASKK
jgi:hypothetical protein